VSYSAIDQLTGDVLFGGRVRACTVEQAEVFRNDARPDFVALANECLLGSGEIYLAFIRMVAAAPGLADKAATADGVDQAQVTDADLLSTVQANWQVVAGLYFDADGTPIEVQL
jgi:hypothetical protein